MKAAIIVDSTAGLSKEVTKNPNVFQLFLSTIFEDGTVYVDSPNEQSTQEFYNRMEQESALPKSSQPEPQQVYDVFERILAEGYDTVFGLFLSSKISGTYQTVHSVSQEFTDRLSIHLIDSELTSFVMEGITKNLLTLTQKDLLPESILSNIDSALKRSAFYFVPSTLDNLVKGGRLSSISGLIGNLLSIKPIITISHESNGAIIVSEKVRSMKKALNRLYILACEHIDQYPDNAYITVGHTGAPKDAELLRDQLLVTYPEASIQIGFITPVLGTHGGTGAVSINIAPLEK